MALYKLKSLFLENQKFFRVCNSINEFKNIVPIFTILAKGDLYFY